MDVYEQSRLGTTSSPGGMVARFRSSEPGVFAIWCRDAFPGETEVVCMLYSLVLGNDGRVEADGDRERNAARVRTVNETLKKALGRSGTIVPMKPSNHVDPPDFSNLCRSCRRQKEPVLE